MNAATETVLAANITLALENLEQAASYLRLSATLTGDEAVDLRRLAAKIGAEAAKELAALAR